MQNSKLLRVIKIIKNGGIVIFPTDTAFGIGCRIDDEEAVQRLFAIKERSDTQATPVLVNSISMAEQYFSSISPEMRKLMEQYWPGALTIIARSTAEKVSPLIRGGGDTVGLRMPKHEIPLKIIKAVGIPIIGTSANFHGQPTPYIFEDLDKELIKKVDSVIAGICPLREASTVVDCSVTPWKILRQGAINLDV